MDVPPSLPAQLYLLGYDGRKQRVVTNDRFPRLIRAAALTELLLCGRIADADGTVRVTADTPLGDPALDDLLHRIARSRPRRWRHWSSDPGHVTARAVRDGLEAGRWIEVELRRPSLIHDRSRVRVRDPHVVQRLAARVGRALTDPPSRIDDRQAALVALAAAGRLRTVLPWAARRAHRRRIAQLTARAGAAAPALHKAAWGLGTLALVASAG